MLFFAIFLLRFTGGLWEYVSYETYDRIKFDMQNRIRLGKLDAVVMRFFHKHPIIYTFANACAFYISFNSVMWWHGRCLAAFDQRDIIFQSLPSVKQGIMTAITEKIVTGLDPVTVQRHLANATCVAGVCDVEELHANLARLDYAYLESVLSRVSYHELFGWEAAVLVSEWTMTGYFVASAFLSIFLLKLMGHTFWAHRKSTNFCSVHTRLVPILITIY